MNVWKPLAIAAGAVFALSVIVRICDAVFTGIVRRAVHAEMVEKRPAMSSPPGRAGVERENEVLAFRPLSEDAVEVTVRLNGGITNMVFRKAP